MPPVFESSQGDKRRRNYTDEKRKQREAIKSAIDKAVEARNSAVAARNSQRAQVSRRDSTDSSSSHDPAPSVMERVYPLDSFSAVPLTLPNCWMLCMKNQIYNTDQWVVVLSFVTLYQPTK